MATIEQKMRLEPRDIHPARTIVIMEATVWSWSYDLSMCAKDTKPVSTALDSKKIVQPADVAMHSRRSAVDSDIFDTEISISCFLIGILEVPVIRMAETKLTAH